MPQFGDVARSRDVDTLSAMLGDIPDTTTEAGMLQAMDLVYRTVMSKVNKAKAPVRMREGKKYFVWQGKMPRDVFHVLWPALGQSMLVDKETADAITGAIKDRLSADGILFCVEANKHAPSTWFINEHFLPSTTKTVPEAVEEAETVTTSEASVKQFQCRDSECTASFDVEAGRITHEMKIHQFAVGDDGVRLPFDSSFSDEYVKGVLVDVLREAGDSLTLRGLEQGAVAKDPRMRKVAVAAGLRMLLSAGVVEDRQVGMRTRYQLTQKGAQESADAVVSEIAAIAAAIPRTVDSSVFSLKRTLASLKGSAIAVATDLAHVEKHVLELEQQVAALQHENAALKTKQVAAGSAANSARVTELEKQLAEVTEERDHYKAQWEVFQQAVQGVLKTKE